MSFLKKTVAKAVYQLTIQAIQLIVILDLGLKLAPPAGIVYIMGIKTL